MSSSSRIHHRLAPLSTLALSLALPFAGAACGSEPASELGSTPYRFDRGAVTFDEALSQLDVSLTGAEARARSQTDAWSPLAAVVGYRMARARLSGDLGDYERAEADLEQAFARAVAGGGPWLVAAQLHFTLHRLDEASAAVDRADAAVLIDDPTRAAIAGLRGDIALQRGDMDEARSQLEMAESLDPTSSSASRLALWHWRSGDFAAAEAGYRSAMDRYRGLSAEARSWFHLQLGLLDLDRGAYDDALVHYLDANAELSGYYLVEEHVAEILVLTGEAEQARYIYDEVVERTDAPEFMDALAELHAEAGDAATSAAWVAAARERYEADIARMPDAAIGHALDHYLSFGPAERALELAEQNYELRPNPGAEAQLALAQLGVGELDAAVERMDAALAGGWRSFELHETGAMIYAAAGLDDAAEQQRTQACELAPALCLED